MTSQCTLKLLTVPLVLRENYSDIGAEKTLKWCTKNYNCWGLDTIKSWCF